MSDEQTPPPIPPPADSTPSLWEPSQIPVPTPAVPRQYPATSAMAVVALVFGALSFITCPILFAIVALVLAHNANKEIKASNGMVTGEGLVTAARVLAWVNIALGAAFVLFFAFFALFAVLVNAVN